jgi:hypothetical protein
MDDMMTRKAFLATSAGLAATLATTASPGLRDAAAAVPQGYGKENIREVRGEVLEWIDELNLDVHDYNGYRARALRRLEAARADLLEALKAQHAVDRTDVGSDRNLRTIRDAISRRISQLERDPSDYGGHRVGAIEDLREARSMVELALKVDASNHG